MIDKENLWLPLLAGKISMSPSAVLYKKRLWSRAAYTKK